MKDQLIEGGAFAVYKLLFMVYLFSSVLQEKLFEVGFNIYFVYIGLIGQIVATLVVMHKITNKDGYVIKVRPNKILATILQLIIAPILSLLITSIFFKEVNAASALLAFAIGAFWEIAWSYIKKYLEKYLKIQDDDKLPETFKEDRPDKGPR